MKTVGKKWIALVLSVVLIVQSVMVGVNAEEVLENPDAGIETESVTEPAHIIAEADNKREDSVKHFVLNNGTYMAASYGETIHIKDENGKYEDVDNRLHDNGERLVPRRALNEMSLAKSLSDKAAVSMSVEDVKISWSYEGIKEGTTAEIKEEKYELSGDDAFLTLPNLTGKAVYKDAYLDTDIEVNVESYSIKDNILIKSRKAPETFVINYDIGNLSAKQVDSKTISLSKDGKEVANISAPYMYDKKGEISKELGLKIISVKDSTLKVLIEYDNSWAKANGREFPVTIDPGAVFVLNKDDILYKYSYTNTGVIENAPGTLYVGYNTTFGTACSSVKLTSLPGLAKGDTVYKADLSLYLNTFRLANSSQVINCDAYEINGSWSGFNASTIYVPGTGPSYYNTVIDYQKASYGAIKAYKTWDVTKLVKKWYANTATNNGIVIKPSNYITSDDNVAWFSTPANAPSGTNLKKPAFRIYYLNAKGLENYWSYTECAAGSATASVNNYTGNLVVSAPLISTTSENMPASLSLYFNGYQTGQHFPDSICGTGFKTNYDLRIQAIPNDSSELNTALRAAGYYYKFVDADGTEHYMRSTAANYTDNGTYKDDSGLGLTLTRITGTGFTLEDKDHNKMAFNTAGKITQIFNKLSSSTTDDTIRFTYNNDGFLEEITDGSGKKLILSRNTNNALISVTEVIGEQEQYNRMVSLQYHINSAKLASINYYDGSKLSFEYDNDPNNTLICYHITKIKAEDGTGLVLSYPSSVTNASQAKVQSIYEVSSNGTTRTGLNFAYNTDNTTTITDNDGFAETYVFDSVGRAISVYSSEGANSSDWSAWTDTNATFSNNKLKSSYGTEKPTINLIRDHSFEKGFTYWAAIGGNAVSDTSNSYIGAKGVRITHSALTDSDVVAQSVSGVQSGYYTLSAYVKASSISGTGGGYLYIKYINSNATVIEKSDYITDTSGEWQRVSMLENIPSTATNVTIGIGMENATGTLYADNIQFESGYLSDYNLAENPVFAFGNYSYLGSTSDIVNVSDAPLTELNKAMRVTGTVSTTPYIAQTIYVRKPAANLAINLSGFAKGNSVGTINDTNRTFGLKVHFYFTDGTYELVTIKNYDCYSSAWQYMSYIAMPSAANSNKTVNYINIYYVYHFNRNTALFTGFNVRIDPTAQSFSYDSKGNLQSAKMASGVEGTNSFDSTTNRLLSSTDPLNGSYSYTYNTGNLQYQLNKAHHAGYNQDFEFTYNSHGQVISSSQSQTGNTTGSKFESSVAYSESGDKITSTTDIADRTTTLSYDSYGRVTTSTTNNVATNYTYDSGNRITSVSALRDSGDSSTAVQNSYTYTADDTNTQNIYEPVGILTNITHGGTIYGFTYNAYGQTETVKIGNQYLSEYYYDDNGNLQLMYYGNGDEVANQYDTLNRLKSTIRNDQYKTYYYYNKNGQVARKADVSPGYSIYSNYHYDMLGRLTAQHINSKNIRLNYSYNNIDQLTKTRYNVKGTTHGSDYTYGNWSVNTATTLTNGAALYKSFNHLVQPDNTVYSSSGSALKKSYTYKEVNGKNYGLVSSLTYQNGTYSGSTFTAGNTSNTYSYTYDSFGNITAVYLNNTLREQYAYDDLGELVRADSLDTGYTLVIEYDNLGNITKMKKTACTFGDLTNCQFTEYNYTYGNTSWTDLLTNYNGSNIYYDEIGNPTTYYTGADLTWIGRRLRKYTLGDLTNTYTYNDDGIRVKKVSADSGTNTTTTTEYVLDGANIIAIIENGAVKTRFYYDADGTRIAMDYQGNTYYYQYNLQGDVIALLDSTFTPVVTYTYGPWGTVEDITDSTNINLGTVNPFLYRGYYYDSDTELYYLNSRYYDPETGRFINADDASSLAYSLQNFVQYNLFAYCWGNPINMLDRSGKLPEPVQTIVNLIIREINFSNNKKYEVKGIINDQSKYSDLRIGLWGSDHSGCGWIAVYNVMILLGSPQSAADVIRYYDPHYTILYGTFGINPLAIPNYYLSKGFHSMHNTIPFVMPDNIEAVAQNSTACILFYSHSEGAHYTALQWNGTQYNIYNDIIPNSSSIKNYMQSVGGTFITIWCIN